MVFIYWEFDDVPFYASYQQFGLTVQLMETGRVQRLDFWMNVSWMMMRASVNVSPMLLANLMVFLVLVLVNNSRYCYFRDFGDKEISLIDIGEVVLSSTYTHEYTHNTHQHIIQS